MVPSRWAGFTLKHILQRASEDDENKSILLHLGATVLLKDHSYRDYEPVMTQQDAADTQIISH